MINLTLSYAAILVADFLMRKKQSHLYGAFIMSKFKNVNRTRRFESNNV